MSPVGAIFVPFPPKTGTNMLHPLPPNRGTCPLSSPVEASSKASQPNALVSFKQIAGDREADLLANMGSGTGRGSAGVELPEF